MLVVGMVAVSLKSTRHYKHVKSCVVAASLCIAPFFSLGLTCESCLAVMAGSRLAAHERSELLMRGWMLWPRMLF